MSLIYGPSNRERIVATERVYSQGVGGSMEQVFVRGADGKVTATYEKVRPFIFASSASEKLKSFEGVDGIEIKPLKGSGHYDRLVLANTQWKLKDVTEELDSDHQYVLSKSAAFMLQTGHTFFKGMSFKDMLVAYVDIETWATGNFPNSKISGDHIYVISVLLSTGEKRVFALDKDINDGRFDEHVVTIDTEKSLLKLFVNYLSKVDPDVICGHNINNFDLPYLQDRCKLHGVMFGIGRDGSEPHSFPTKMKLAERDVDYINHKVYGRHVMDTMLLAMKVDVVKRDMPGYGLKVLVRDYLKKAAADREYIEGDALKQTWLDDKKKVLRYALDDVLEAEILLRTFGQAYFYLAQMLPYGLQDCARLGSGTLFETIFIREYLRRGYSIPKKDAPRDIPGGFAGIFQFGHIGAPCIYLDVASLYPTLAEELVIMPSKDDLCIYQPVIRELKAFRLKIKRQKEEATDRDQIETLGAIDGACKVVLNSGSYGILASQYFPWNDYDEAERITVNGQRVIKSMIMAATDLGGHVVKVDTDGMLVAMPIAYRTEAQEKVFAKMVEEHVNELVNNGLFEGAFDQELQIEKKLEFVEEETESEE